MNEQKRCEVCGAPIKKLHANRANRYCSQRCYAASGSRTKRKSERVKGARMRTAKGHPIAPPSGVVAVSRLTLYDKIGGGGHPCHWCGEIVEWKRGLAPGALVVDHLNWDRNDDRVENLVPSCNACNAHRVADKSRRLIGADEPTMLWGGKKTRAVERNCEGCDEPFLALPAEVRKGKGRFCSRSCARGAPRNPKTP